MEINLVWWNLRTWLITITELCASVAGDVLVYMHIHVLKTAYHTLISIIHLFCLEEDVALWYDHLFMVQ